MLDMAMAAITAATMGGGGAAGGLAKAGGGMAARQMVMSTALKIAVAKETATISALSLTPILMEAANEVIQMLFAVASTGGGGGGGKWVDEIAKELIVAKSAGASGIYERILNSNSGSLLRAMIRTGSLDGVVAALKTVAEIAAENGYRQVIIAETEGGAGIFRWLVTDNGIANTVVRVLP